MMVALQERLVSMRFLVLLILLCGMGTRRPVWAVPAYGPPTQEGLQNINTANGTEYMPSISPDGLTVYFTYAPPPVPQKGHFFKYATRSTNMEPFGLPAKLPGLDTDANQYAPDISADGLEIFYYVRSAGPLRDLYESTRASLTQPFGPPIPLTGLNTAYSESSPSISSDGLTLCFDSDRLGTSHIWMASRPNLASPFGPPTMVAALMTEAGEGSPDLSPDSLKLFYTSDGYTYVSERGTVLDGFSPGVRLLSIPQGYGNPTVSSNGDLFLSAKEPGSGLYDLWCSRIIPEPSALTLSTLGLVFILRKRREWNT